MISLLLFAEGRIFLVFGLRDYLRFEYVLFCCPFQSRVDYRRLQSGVDYCMFQSGVDIHCATRLRSQSGVIYRRLKIQIWCRLRRHLS